MVSALVIGSALCSARCLEKRSSRAAGGTCRGSVSDGRVLAVPQGVEPQGNPRGPQGNPRGPQGNPRGTPGDPRGTPGEPQGNPGVVRCRTAGFFGGVR
eukprot:CAMPEP_0204380254 /NCGR_PEP_ID=MMETSP0469-20131031/53234_1 /ASSEMBLY_ACC=CAM_ASM_000384 /TAXON_ID=2969 /ORGANISM="Oxyrrhis marina" /LENGTH=98 /DNA_ID=CAMNT_0051371853 /DNA_START=83 /DNA_END=376 /DNA_ORIENTATION=-